MLLTHAMEVTITSRQCYGGTGMYTVKAGDGELTEIRNRFLSHAPSHMHFRGRKCFLISSVNFRQNSLHSLWLKQFQADKLSQRLFWFPPVLCEIGVRHKTVVSWSYFFFHMCCSHQIKSPESCFQFLYVRL